MKFILVYPGPLYESLPYTLRVSKAVAVSFTFLDFHLVALGGQLRAMI